MKEIYVSYILRIFHSKHYLFLLITLFFLPELSASDQTKSFRSDNFQLIMSRIQAANKNVSLTSTENNATTYLQSVLNDGSFSDINYADLSTTNWQPQTHLDRLKPIVLAYSMSGVYIVSIKT